MDKIASLGDGHRFATGSQDYSIRIFDLSTCSLQGVFDSSNGGHTNKITALLWLGRDNVNMLASGSADSTVKLWNVASLTLVRTLEGHTNWITSLAYLGKGNLASGSADFAIKVWSISNGGSLLTTLTGHTSEVSGLSLVGNDSMASVSFDGSIKIWNLNSIYPSHNQCPDRFGTHLFSILS